MMNIAILGAQGIGRFHAREFYSLGCDIKAILGQTEKSSKQTAKMLLSEFGINAKPYWELDALLKEKIDIASICLPPEMHEKYTEACLKKKINVLCEKPFVSNLTAAENLLNLAKEYKKILSINTQWPTILEFLNYAQPVKSFEMYMQPGKKGYKLLEDSLPHMNSMLIKLHGIGTIKNLDFLIKKEKEVKLTFDYQNENENCDVKYHMLFKKDRPRKVEFKINKKKFCRKVEKNYNQSILSNGKEIIIKDPLSLSISNFVETIEKKRKPFFSNKEILENVRMQEFIIKKYLNN